ncbi:GntR family transcriptional regulator [Marinilabilia salmonicolor]|uniref:GntR family transcriptional regulator n=1 Tax=Marinilabilia salmonicolor TaxID=989 RepID=UPI00029A5DFF|nr:GntR family transcriptional regulator [Marinilabilia salmonicolor]
MITIDKKSGVPLHEQIEKKLRELIARPEYMKDGKMLPTETELSKKLEVSRTTIRQAITSLVNDGLLIRRKGSGTKVSTNGIEGVGRKWKSFSQEMKSLGINIKNFELHLLWEVPPKNVAAFFKIDSTTPVLTLQRLRGSHSGPFVFFISYFNPKLCLTGNENFNRPLYDVLQEECGCIVSTSHEKISAVNADNLLSKKLKVDLNTALLKRVREVYDINKMPIEYNIGLYRSDKFTYSISFS